MGGVRVVQGVGPGWVCGGFAWKDGKVTDYRIVADTVPEKKAEVWVRVNGERKQVVPLANK